MVVCWLSVMVTPGRKIFVLMPGWRGSAMFGRPISEIEPFWMVVNPNVEPRIRRHERHDVGRR